MTPYALQSPFPGLDSGGGQADQRAEEVGLDSGPAAGVPQGFPGLLRFPVVAMIEQVDPVQIRPAFVPPAGLRRRQSFSDGQSTVARAIARWMRKLPRHIGIRWEPLVRPRTGRVLRRRIGHGSIDRAAGSNSRTAAPLQSDGVF